MQSIDTLPGWLLTRIVALDVFRPGTAGCILRASVERRHVIAAFLSATDAIHDSEEVAHFLVERGHDAILQRAYKYVPVGLRASLGRCGPKVHEPKFYSRLLAMLCDGPAHAISVIRQVDQLTPDLLDIIASLPADLCDVRIVQKLTREQASDVMLAVDLLDRRGVDRCAVIEALRRSNKVAETIKRWSFRMSFPRGPIAQCTVYQPITNGLELLAASKAYRNCSRRYFTTLLEGGHAFGEFQHDGRRCLISFDKSQGYWLAEGVYVYRNNEVSTNLSEAAYAFAARNGVLTRRMVDRGDRAMDALRRLSRFYADWDV